MGDVFLGDVFFFIHQVQSTFGINDDRNAQKQKVINNKQ